MMYRSWLTLLLLFAVPGHAASASPLTLYAEIAPQAWLAQRILGGTGQIHVLVPGGQIPEHYAPSPRQVAAATAADLYLQCGVLALDRRWTHALQEGGGPRIVRCCQLDDPTSIADPHIWTDPGKALHIAQQILAALVEARPALAVVYRINYHLLEMELRAVDLGIQQRLAPLRHRHFLVEHPAWGHFAARYQLTQISLEPLHGHDVGPSPQDIIRAIALGRQHHIRTLFVQPGAEHRSARVVAETLQIPMQTLDPLAPDYLNDLLQATEAIIRSIEP